MICCAARGSRMGRHIEVDHLPPIVQQYDEAVQDIESRSRHGEKINCRDLTSMIPKKALPCLRRWLATAASILRNC